MTPEQFDAFDRCDKFAFLFAMICLLLLVLAFTLTAWLCIPAVISLLVCIYYSKRCMKIVEDRD